MRDYFPGQKPDEQVKALVRPHWLSLLGVIILTLVAALLPIGVLIAMNAVDAPALVGTRGAVAAAVLGGYYVTLITFFFIRWLSVYLDVGIITDQRIVDIDQRSLFSRNVAELDCKMVQDVSTDKNGILQTVFDFGNVIIQTAGERPNFTFRNIPHPELLVDTVQEAVEGRGDESDQAVSAAAESMQDAAETMKEAAAGIKHDTPAEAPTQDQAASTPPPAEPAAPATEPASTAEQSSGPADDLPNLPREYDK